MYKLGLEKTEELEVKMPAFTGSLRKQRNSRKTPTSASLTLLKPLIVQIIKNCEKFLKRWEYQTTLLVSSETCIWVQKQQSELNMEQRTDSKLGKEYRRTAYCQPAYLNNMHSTFGFPGSSASREFTCSMGDLGFMTGWERSPGEGNGYALQYSGLEHSMDCIM